MFMPPLTAGLIERRSGLVAAGNQNLRFVRVARFAPDVLAVYVAAIERILKRQAGVQRIVHRTPSEVIALAVAGFRYKEYFADGHWIRHITIVCEAWHLISNVMIQSSAKSHETLRSVARDRCIDCHSQWSIQSHSPNWDLERDRNKDHRTKRPDDQPSPAGALDLHWQSLQPHDH